MKLLIVSATHRESEKLSALKSAQHTISVMVTGIGTVNTAYQLGKILSRETFDLVLNIGVCGSYDRFLPLGQVVHVEEEIFGDLGATNSAGAFLDLKSMGFNHFAGGEKDYFNAVVNPNDLNDFFDPSMIKIIPARGLTVNTVSGDLARIERMQALFKPQIETMEGAAVAAVCIQEGVPYFEFRSISNYVEPRDSSKWNIQLACSAIQDFAIRLLSNIKLKK